MDKPNNIKTNIKTLLQLINKSQLKRNKKVKN